MKLGISVKIDVTKIDKARLFTGKNGNKYLDMTTFVDLDNPGQYGDHGFISQDVTKDERQQGVKGNILGNCKVFYNDSQQQQQGGFQQPQAHPNQTGGGFQQPQQFQPQPQAVTQMAQQQAEPTFDDDVPF